jgi:hypothetical protein
MDPTPQTIILVLLVIVAGTYLLRTLRNAQEEGSTWVLKSNVFQKWTEARDAKVEKEAKETRDLIRDFRDEFAARFEDLKDLHATKAEVERWKGRTRTLEALQQAQHGTAIPSDSSSFHHGDHA